MKKKRKEKIAAIKDEIKKIIHSHPHINGLHGLYVDEVDKEIKFDQLLALMLRIG